jgi:hypothetical protein
MSTVHQYGAFLCLTLNETESLTFNGSTLRSFAFFLSALCGFCFYRKVP